jgi:hypothetical protein
MLTYSNPICKAVDDRLVREKENPRGVFADPTGDIAKSRECGCKICSLVCRMLDDSKKEEAEAKFKARKTPTDVTLEFSGAGMKVEGLEAFVTECEWERLLFTGMEEYMECPEGPRLPCPTSGNVCLFHSYV